MIIVRKYTGLIGITLLMAILLMGGGCQKGESYSDLLKTEEKAVNWYLASHRVEPGIPEDSVFLVGDDAPYYRMDEDGTVYMQVLNPGDENLRPKANDKVYFRYSRRNIKFDYEGVPQVPAGNLDDLNSEDGETSFFFGNNVYPNTTQWGTGLQVPLNYLGYNSEVKLVVKAYSGLLTEQANCVPYLLHVKYYKAQY